ncbi:MAG: TonB-dependent receptor, partial [Novosphingobium sp.]
MKYLLLLTCSLVLSAPAVAQDSRPDEVELERVTVCCSRPNDAGITVVASGTSQPIRETGQSISVIGAEEIAAVQGPDLTRVLE